MMKRTAQAQRLQTPSKRMMGGAEFKCVYDVSNMDTIESEMRPLGVFMIFDLRLMI